MRRSRRRTARALASLGAGALLVLGASGCNPGAATQASASAEEPAVAATPSAQAEAVLMQSTDQPQAAAVAVAPAPGRVALPVIEKRQPQAVARGGIEAVKRPQQPEQPEGPAPVIVAEAATFDFGSAEQGTEVVHQFKLYNKGPGKLVLERADAG